MRLLRPAICAALLALIAAPAAAAPAYVLSTVNLRAAPGTGNPILTKIPGGSLVDAANCGTGWCEVAWQGRRGFAIATALDLSGRVPARRVVRSTQYVAVSPAPVVVGAPVVVAPAYGYGYYRPYWGYRYGYGYRRRWY